MLKATVDKIIPRLLAGEKVTLKSIPVAVVLAAAGFKREKNTNLWHGYRLVVYSHGRDILPVIGEGKRVRVIVPGRYVVVEK